MILHIDFETQGLPVRGEPSENPAHPYPCSVSAILDDANGKTRQSFYSLIRVPYDRPWEPKAQEVNGLTHDLCDKYGESLQVVTCRLAEMARRAETICAFSHYFDLKFIKISCARVPDGAAMRTIFESKRKACTMEASARHFVGPTARFIKLSLAYQKAFGHGFDGAHTAFDDNMAQRRLYYWLREQGVTDFGDTIVVTKSMPDSVPEDTVAPARKRPAAL